ncbi:hypothetical protein Q9306_23275 [Bacillus sp. WLY-B-L8]|nr:hypothetical protein [Bacillus sp. WLY-B-L8]
MQHRRGQTYIAPGYSGAGTEPIKSEKGTHWSAFSFWGTKNFLT